MCLVALLVKVWGEPGGAKSSKPNRSRSFLSAVASGPMGADGVLSSALSVVFRSPARMHVSGGSFLLRVLKNLVLCVALSGAYTAAIFVGGMVGEVIVASANLPFHVRMGET